MYLIFVEKPQDGCPQRSRNGPDRGRRYGQYLGNRYKHFTNIIWLNGNDFQKWSVASNDAAITAVALGIQQEDPWRPSDRGIKLSGQLFPGYHPNWAPIVVSLILG